VCGSSFFEERKTKKAEWKKTPTKLYAEVAQAEEHSTCNRERMFSINIFGSKVSRNNGLRPKTRMVVDHHPATPIADRGFRP
jgi:hypothetical protein